MCPVPVQVAVLSIHRQDSIRLCLFTLLMNASNIYYFKLILAFVQYMFALDGIGLDWIGLNWIGLDSTEVCSQYFLLISIYYVQSKDQIKRDRRTDPPCCLCNCRRRRRRKVSAIGKSIIMYRAN